MTSPLCRKLCSQRPLLRVSSSASALKWRNSAATILFQRTSFSGSEPAAAASEYFDSAGTTASSVENTMIIEPPTRSELRRVALQAALPMVGFGFMDQALMIHAGNAIDCTIGVTFGLSTLSAAAVGQIVANSGGIVFGESLQRVFTKFTCFEPCHLSASQLSLKVVERSRFKGTFLGLIAGCVLGLINLAFIDTQRSSNLKLHKALADEDRKMKAVFEIDISNQHSLSEKHRPATTLTLRGPSMEGALTQMLEALQEEGCSLLELSAKPTSSSSSSSSSSHSCTSENKGNSGCGGTVCYEDVFVIRRNGNAIPEEELGPLAHRLLEQKLEALVLLPSSSSTAAAELKGDPECSKLELKQ